jgi:hypothetical protein
VKEGQDSLDQFRSYYLKDPDVDDSAPCYGLEHYFTHLVEFLIWQFFRLNDKSFFEPR